MHIHYYNLALCCTKVDLLIIRSPNAAGYGRLEIEHGGPIPLSSHRTHQHKAILITDERHTAIMGPGEVSDRRIPVIDKFYGPTALVLDPDKYDAGAIARRQLLIGFVPFDQNYLPIINCD